MKKVIRLTEGDIHRIIKESVKRVLREAQDEVSIGYKTWNNEKLQKVANFLKYVGLPIQIESTYTHGPNPGTEEYSHNKLSGGDIYITEKLPKEQAYEISKKLFEKFGKFVRVNGRLCQNIEEIGMELGVSF